MQGCGGGGWTRRGGGLRRAQNRQRDPCHRPGHATCSLGRLGTGHCGGSPLPSPASKASRAETDAGEPEDSVGGNKCDAGNGREQRRRNALIMFPNPDRPHWLSLLSFQVSRCHAEALSVRGSGQWPLCLPLLSLPGSQAWSLGLAPLLSHSEGPKGPESALSPPKPSSPLPPTASHAASPLPGRLSTSRQGPWHEAFAGGAQREPLEQAPYLHVRDHPRRPLAFTCLASLTESLVSLVRSWGSRWAAGAISTTF